MIKKAVTKKSTRKAPEKKDDSSIHIVQTSKTPTVLNKKSILTYHVGVDVEDKLFIRIHSNTGGGFFSSKEWVSVDDIKAVLENVPADSPITSLYLTPLFKGKSVNTPGFLLAVLLKEGLLAPFEEGKKRQYVFSGADKFLSRINKKIK